jgi:methylase of polypeptide subunit release factors
MGPQDWHSLPEVGSVIPPSDQMMSAFNFAGISLPLALAPGVAVPNLYSKVLLETIWAHPDSILLDVGTGCGVVAAGAAKLFTCRTIVSDIDPDAVNLAIRNVRLSSPNACLGGVAMDGLSGIRSNSVDVLVSQPPQTPAPPGSLASTSAITDGGTDGLDFIRLLLSETGRVLKINGAAYIVLASYLSLNSFMELAVRFGLRSEELSRQRCRLSPMTKARLPYLKTLGWTPGIQPDGDEFMELCVFRLSVE